MAARGGGCLVRLLRSLRKAEQPQGIASQRAVRDGSIRPCPRGGSSGGAFASQQTPVVGTGGSGWPCVLRVRVKIMEWIRVRTDRDFPTILHVGDPIISTRTRMYVAVRTPLRGLHQVIVVATRADDGERQPEAVAGVASRVSRRRGGAIRLPLGLVCAPHLGLPPARPFPSSIFLDKNRCDITNPI
eukprot:COSAG01_NODE_9703_length_2365_cov_40.628420_2_plen_187_part_00